MYKFKKVSGEFVVDIVKHTLNVLQQEPGTTVHIGTDSQNVGSNSIYSIVIAYRFETRGVHYISHTFKISKILDQWTRLWKEAELSIEVAQWLSEKIPWIKIEIDLDYNSDSNYFSSKLVSSAGGWASSLGYKINIKPNSQIATKAADHTCR